ncbi:MULTISPECIES: papain-like cysteine protease family protein [Streptomyces]|uniref:Papain-like cysteine protease family protein n=1 Tax=Streptomyces ramulosus TaxID=47762 RepID=A0ABW1FS16_9ACTN
MPRPRTVRRRRLPAAALAAAALTVLPAASATAAPAAPPAPAAAHPAAPRATANSLDIAMQAQENSNWCWAGSGNTIAAWYGRTYTQNQFCNAAFGRPQNTACPNDQATLGNVQNAFAWMGLNPGSYVSGYLAYDTVRGEIDARRPVETRIQWASGGGHMHVLYGYDADRGWVRWGDPWPSNNRYNWGDYGYYVNGNDFSWTHSLYRTGA